MKKIKHILPKESYFIPNHSILFDIETLGFSSKYQPIYMIGYAYSSNNQTYLYQLFSESNDDEINLLNEFLHKLHSFQTMITFNGQMFDILYIKNRCKLYDLDVDFSYFESIDLFLQAKKLSKIIALDHYKQKNLEEFLGIHREEYISGGELISVYKKYLQHSSKEDLDMLLLHNYEDVLYMIPLMKLLHYEMNLKDTSNSFNFKYESDQRIFFYKEVLTDFPVTIYYETDTMFIQLKKNIIQGSLKLYQGTLKYFFSNTKDYVYLTKDEMILPKQLADNIPASEKCVAKKEQCFAPCEGLFLNLFFTDQSKLHLQNEKIYQSEYTDKKRYIKIDPDNISPEWLNHYLSLSIPLLLLK